MSVRPEVAAQRDIPPPAQMTADPASAGLDHQLTVRGMQTGAVGQRPQVSVGPPGAVHRRGCGSRHDHAHFLLPHNRNYYILTGDGRERNDQSALLAIMRCGVALRRYRRGERLAINPVVGRRPQSRLPDLRVSIDLTKAAPIRGRWARYRR